MFVLQSRWKPEGGSLYYYGLRNKEHMFRNRVRLNRRQRAVIEALPCELTPAQKRSLGSLLGVQVVEEKMVRRVPKSLSEARFCTTCCANDFIIPGLEFDGEGRCPMCQTAHETRTLKSVVPLVTQLPRAKKSRFDVAVFYTGGKDSTFLLYHLAKVLGLRVLALTWEIPYISPHAKASIEGAKKAFPNVEFLVRTVSADDLRRVYCKLLELSANTCACPSLAYVLFYPELVANRVPYFATGNEPVQMLGLYYNHLAPRIAYSFADNRFLQAIVNLGRLVTLHPPLRRGQLHTLMTMKQLAYGDHPLKKMSGYRSELVSNVVTAIHEVPAFLPPLRRCIRASSFTGHIPAFVQFDLDAACGGTYDWNKVRDILLGECGWVPPPDDGKALHTSCSIERCKDRSQFLRFYNCESKMIPFSAIEISLASRNCGRSREEMMYEIEHLLGFSLEELPECALMRGWAEQTPQ